MLRSGFFGGVCKFLFWLCRLFFRLPYIGGCGFGWNGFGRIGRDFRLPLRWVVGFQAA